MQTDSTPVVLSPQDVARFWAKVDKSGGTDACWPWIAGCSPRGYGRVYQGGRGFQAHRIAWIYTNGPIAAGMSVCHTCDNPPCCNPSHLWLGTQAENNADRDAKGRQVALTGDAHHSRMHPELRPRGERHHAAKLTGSDIPIIKSLCAAGNHSRSAIGEMFGVSGSTINDIMAGRTWTEPGKSYRAGRAR